jgi:hypothetical protein
MALHKHTPAERKSIKLAKKRKNIKLTKKGK